MMGKTLLCSEQPVKPSSQPLPGGLAVLRTTFCLADFFEDLGTQIHTFCVCVCAGVVYYRFDCV